MMLKAGTIEELQAKISIREFKTWLAYRKKYGPMNPVRMYDAGHAIIASMISNAHGGKAKPEDFMPYGREVKSEYVSGEEFVAMLAKAKGVKIGKRR